MDGDRIMQDPALARYPIVMQGNAAWVEKRVLRGQRFIVVEQRALDDVACPL
jgi:hypothetical protein